MISAALWPRLVPAEPAQASLPGSATPSLEVMEMCAMRRLGDTPRKIPKFFFSPLLPSQGKGARPRPPRIFAGNKRGALLLRENPVPVYGIQFLEYIFCEFEPDINTIRDTRKCCPAEFQNRSTWARRIHDVSAELGEK
jgi:hypothetical protein